MSAFGNDEKDDVYYAVKNFLETHKISELLEIIQYCVESKENENA